MHNNDSGEGLPPGRPAGGRNKFKDMVLKTIMDLDIESCSRCFGAILHVYKNTLESSPIQSQLAQVYAGGATSWIHSEDTEELSRTFIMQIAKNLAGHSDWNSARYWESYYSSSTTSSTLLRRLPPRVTIICGTGTLEPRIASSTLWIQPECKLTKH